MHYNPVRIDAGAGGLARVAGHVPPWGDVLLVTTEGFVRRGQADEVRTVLGAERVHVYAEVTPNPELDALDLAKRRFADLQPSAIVALGGGSAIDAAKALSVILDSAQSAPLEHALRQGAGQAWDKAIPVVAIPTTSGTGAEVTPFATVWDSVHHRKHSIAGDAVFPAVAILDPELALSLPEKETLHTALDAISHAMESLWNRNRTSVSEVFAAQALALAVDALPRVLGEPGNLSARSAMQQASLLAGLAISQTRTAIAHAISYPLTSHYGIPHGLACSFTLPNILSEYLQQNEELRFRSLLTAAGGLLEGLDLRVRVAEYATVAQIDALRSEMFQPGRADNYVGVPDLDRFLR